MRKPGVLIVQGLFWALVCLFLSSSCKKTGEDIVFDFIAAYPSAIKTYPAKELLFSGSRPEGFKLHGWTRDPDAENDSILFPSQRKAASLDLGAVRVEDRRLALQIKPLLAMPLAESAGLRIFFNGKKKITTRLGWEGFKEIRFAVAKEDVRIGQNRLTFSIFGGSQLKEKYWLALRRLDIMPKKLLPKVPSSPQPAPFQLISRRLLFSKKRAIQQSSETSLDYYLKIPKGGRLSLEVSRENPARTPTGGQKFLVWLETDEGEKKVVWEKVFEDGSSAKRIPVDVDLSSYAGRIVQLSFVYLDASPASNPSPRLLLWQPRLVFEGPGKSDETEVLRNLELKRPFNIIIYLCDAMRPDFMPFFAYKKNLAPRMAEFAREGIVFKNAFAQGPWTRPSIGALFTGLHPFAHQAVSLKSGLMDELDTLAEVLQKSGYRTIGVSANAGIKEFFNFNQGFTSFRYHSNLSGGSADRLNGYALEELKKSKVPFFLYLHVMETHRPYKLRQEYYPESLAKGGEPEGRFVYGRTRRGKKQKIYLDANILLYEAAIRQTDQSFGDLMAGLKSLGLYDNSLIILMNDHGEEFYEHSATAHGKTLFQEAIKQLLVVKLPAGLRAGTEIDENVQEIDIYPTLLDLAGISFPDTLLGRSLKERLLSAAPPDSPLHDDIYIETLGVNAVQNIRTVIDGPWKLILKSRDWPKEPEGFKLFNLREDPGEKKDLFMENCVAAEYLMGRLKGWMENEKKLARISGRSAEKQLTAKEIEELKALGYIR